MRIDTFIVRLIAFIVRLIAFIARLIAWFRLPFAYFDGKLHGIGHKIIFDFEKQIESTLYVTRNTAIQKDIELIDFVVDGNRDGL